MYKILIKLLATRINLVTVFVVYYGLLIKIYSFIRNISIKCDKKNYTRYTQLLAQKIIYFCRGKLFSRLCRPHSVHQGCLKRWLGRHTVHGYLVSGELELWRREGHWGRRGGGLPGWPPGLIGPRCRRCRVHWSYRGNHCYRSYWLTQSPARL